MYDLSSTIMVGLFTYMFNQKYLISKIAKKFSIVRNSKKITLYSLFGNPRWIVNIPIFLHGNLIG